MHPSIHFLELHILAANSSQVKIEQVNNFNTQNIFIVSSPPLRNSDKTSKIQSKIIYGSIKLNHLVLSATVRTSCSNINPQTPN